MATKTDADAILNDVHDMLAETPSGILAMPELVTRIQKQHGGTLAANRTRVRRAIAGSDSQLVELTSRRRFWDVELSDGDDVMAAWVSQSYDSAQNRVIHRVVFSRQEVHSSQGSGRISWVSTRGILATIVATQKQEAEKARKAAIIEQRQRDKEQAEKRAQEKRESWELAREQDPEYVDLLLRLQKAVPGLEVRVVCARSAPVVWAMSEASPEVAEGFKAFLRQAFSSAPAA